MFAPGARRVRNGCEVTADTGSTPTPTEAALADVFATVLGVESVGIHNNFFTVGGDSILALVVRSKAEKRGFSFDIEELFDRPTVAQLAESISHPTAEPAGVTESLALVPLIDRAALQYAEDAFPATTLQLGMLFQLRADRVDMYKDVFRYRITMPWNAEDFGDAFDRLVERHPALRSSFELNQHSVPLQIVVRRVPRAFDVVTAGTDADVNDYITARHAYRYEVSRAPLYSLRVFVRDDTVDLVFAFHHAILDGWSAANLIRELLQDYFYQLGLDVPPLAIEPHSTTMLAEHARLERQARDDPAAQEFWRTALAGAHATSLESFVSHEAPEASDPAATVLIPRWLQRATADLAKSLGLSMKSLLLAAHCLTLQRLSGEADVTTGLVTHGRPGRAGAEVAVGMFLNTIPIRLTATPARWIDAVELLPSSNAQVIAIGVTHCW